MQIKNWVRVNKTTTAMLIFVLLFGTIHWLKPSLFYTEEGGFREFGVGYKQKTVVPIWLAAIFLSILSYLAVLYFLLIAS
jgi:hypothetical protein